MGLRNMKMTPTYTTYSNVWFIKLHTICLISHVARPHFNFKETMLLSFLSLPLSSKCLHLRITCLDSWPICQGFSGE